MKKLRRWFGQYRGHIALWATMASLLLMVDAFDWRAGRAGLDQLAILLGFVVAFAVESLFAAAKREADELDAQLLRDKRAANAAYGKASYIAGKVEWFRREGAEAHYYDIGSSYPEAMTKPQPDGEVVDAADAPRARDNFGEEGP